MHACQTSSDYNPTLNVVKINSQIIIISGVRTGSVDLFPQDNTLLASCSADKNIRIWGLDFGDCHKSLFAHDQSVSSISFVPGTHQMISAGKDGLVKRWDADNFEHIQTLEVIASSVFPKS